ncbi:MAG: PEP-CTERM sorting domain-containing protein [Gemmataceae bacterium]
MLFVEIAMQLIQTKHVLLIFALLGIIPTLARADFILVGTTGANNKLAVGSFAGGSVLDVHVTGAVNLLPQTGYDWITNPDGSVILMTEPFTYQYALPGSHLYPTVAGGDGINRFSGGGANYDTATGTPYGPFGFAGQETTDTSDPRAIRFGAVVYTFADDPGRADWRLLGYGGQITPPPGGGRLYLAINDSNLDVYPGANSGSYTVTIATVPEPASLALFALGGILMGTVVRTKKGKTR